MEWMMIAVPCIIESAVKEIPPIDDYDSLSSFRRQSWTNNGILFAFNLTSSTFKVDTVIWRTKAFSSDGPLNKLSLASYNLYVLITSLGNNIKKQEKKIQRLITQFPDFPWLFTEQYHLQIMPGFLWLFTILSS